MRTKPIVKDFLYGEKLTKMIENFEDICKKTIKAANGKKSKKICKRKALGSCVYYTLYYDYTNDHLVIESDLDAGNPHSIRLPGSLYGDKLTDENNFRSDVIKSLVRKYFISVYGGRYKNIGEVHDIASM